MDTDVILCDIRQLLKIKCQHINDSKQNKCHLLLQKVQTYINDITKLPINFSNDVTLYVISDATCGLYIMNYVEIFVKMLRLQPLNNFVWQYISCKCNKNFTYFLIRNDITIPIKVLQTFNPTCFDEIIDDIVQKQPSIELLRLLYKKKNNKHVINLINIWKIVPDIKCLKYAIKNNKYEDIRSIISWAPAEGINCLILACKYGDQQCIKIILELIPNIIHNKNCVKIVRYLNIKDFYVVVQCLVNSGYILTKNDVIDTIIYYKGDQYIHNIDKFDLEYDEDVIKVCTQYKFYKYDNVLSQLCKNVDTNWGKIQKIISKNIKPDIDCLVNASTGIIKHMFILYSTSTNEYDRQYCLQIIKSNLLSQNDDKLSYLLEKFMP